MNLTSIFIALAAIVLVTACGNSSSEQAQREADVAVAEFQTSVTTVDSLGEPTAAWSDTKLSDYDTAIADCRSKAKRVEAFTGKPGAIVNSKWSMVSVRRILDAKLAASATVRQQKLAAQAPAAKSDKITELKTQFQQQVKFLDVEGPPEKTWNTDQFAKYEAVLSQAERTLRDLDAALKTNGTPANLFDSKLLLHDKREELKSAKPKIS